MKKRMISLLLLTVFLVTLFAGCSSAKSASSAGSASTSAAAAESGSGSAASAAASGSGSAAASYDFSKDKTYNITAGGIQAAEDNVTLAMQKMADLAKQYSDGTINITVSPAAQLGDATSEMEAVSLGTQEIFVDASSWLSTFVDDALVTSMFFLFRDEAHFRAFLNSDIETNFEQQLADKEGVRVVANNWLRTPRSMVCKKTLTTMDDLKGMKMRVPDIKSYLESAEALGMGTAQVAWGETYLALQQGVVDACESPIDSIYTMKFYETTKHVEMTEHIRDSVMVYMNQQLLDGMSKGQQEAITRAAKEAGDWYSAAVKTAADKYIETMKSENTVFDTPSDELISQMTAAIQTKAADLESQGLWTKGLFDQISALGK
jgi:tripartite ATP-independent transporter DctP family solute receptor